MVLFKVPRANTKLQDIGDVVEMNMPPCTVLSLDVFDTCLVRQVLEPSDVF